MLDLYLIRHAESQMNKNSHLLSGRANYTPLSVEGILQAELLGDRLHSTNTLFSEIYSSPAKRTYDTACIVSEKLNYPIDNIVQSSQLVELNVGDWEGQLRKEIYTPELLSIINSNNWNFTPPNGESQKAVEERMLDFVNKILVPRYSENLVVGVFTHGMAIKCLLRGIMEFTSKITYKIVLDNTSITRLSYKENGWHVLSINDTAHLFNK